MSVDTKTATGRREVHYQSVDDVLADAEEMAASNPKTVGNWTLGQILGHIAIAYNMGTKQSTRMLPAPMRFLAKLFMKKRMTEGPMKPGFKVPNKFAAGVLPKPMSVEEGLEALRTAIARWKATPDRCIHPIFGTLTNEEWEKLEMRHAELHMSFVVPQ